MLCMLMTITTSRKSAVLEKRRKADTTNASKRETDQKTKRNPGLGGNSVKTIHVAKEISKYM